jgi:hypothetical protein
MKKGKRKNPHAVALGRLGGLVRSEAKRRADRENGLKGWPGQKPPKGNCRPPQCTASAPRSQQEAIEVVIASIRARFGDEAIGLGDRGIRFAEFSSEGVSHARTA